MLLLEGSSIFQISFYPVGDDVFFFLHPVGEREGESRKCCFTPGVQKFIYRGVSNLSMGSSRGIGSCDEARLSERMTNELAFG